MLPGSLFDQPTLAPVFAFFPTNLGRLCGLFPLVFGGEWSRVTPVVRFETQQTPL